ncbi:alpha/beta fold hydrolase [Pacificimonas sp. ICDLI1SI03]
MPMIETRDGTSLYVKDWNSGGTEGTIVLIHGWPLNADSWEYQAVPLANAGYRVISYDRRGFGRSEQPWQGYDYDTLSDDLADVMSGCGVTRATIAGFSMGGGEVARYMSRHGGKGVEKAMLISSVVPYMLKTDDNPDGVPEETFKEITDGLKDDRPGFLRSFFKDFYGIGMVKHPLSDAALDWTMMMAMMASPRATLACGDAFAHTDFRSDLRAFNVPTLVLHGTGDKIVPIDVSSRQTAKMIGSNAKLIEYDGAPHGLTATHHEKLAEDMVAFLRA